MNEWIEAFLKISLLILFYVGIVYAIGTGKKRFLIITAIAAITMWSLFPEKIHRNIPDYAMEEMNAQDAGRHPYGRY